MTFTLCDNLSDLPVDERLNYVFGQVLGVQDFRQEQLYLLNKDHRHSRSLHGYGTVWGLEVAPHGTGDELEIQVAAGLAVDTCGRDVTIGSLQCARLNTWLAADSGDGETSNAATLSAIAEGRVAVYVTLRYDQCNTGTQPIFGDPCRADNQAMQPTRIKDDFRLDLSATPPAQIEEDWVRQIGELLGQIELVPGAPPLSDEDRDNLFAELYNLPPRDEPIELPPAPRIYTLPREAAPAILRELLGYWVTTIRPALAPVEDQRILLAALEFELEGNRAVEAGLVVNNSRRPYLLHTRLLQEWLLTASGQPGADGRTILNGAGAPDNELGQAGDFYLDTSATVLYGPKTVDGWPAAGVSLIGRDGADGQNGTDGRDGRTILSGDRAPRQNDGTTGDFWLQTPNAGNPILFGPKAGGNWPAGVPLRGPQGDPGTPGGGGISLYQEFINPSMMTPVEDSRVVRQMLAVGNTRIGQPAYLWQNVGDEAAVVFTWGRPATMAQNNEPLTVQMRLYCAALDDGQVEWRINWRWTRAIQPGNGPEPADTSLAPLNELETGVVMDLFGFQTGDDPQLTVSEWVTLDFNVWPADFLTVVIQPQGLRAPVFLLLAELRWGEGA